MILWIPQSEALKWENKQQHHILQFVFLKVIWTSHGCTREHHFPFYIYILLLWSLCVKMLSGNGNNNVQHCFSTKQTNVIKNEIFRIYIISFHFVAAAAAAVAVKLRKKNKQYDLRSLCLCVYIWRKRKLKFVCAVLLICYLK